MKNESWPFDQPPDCSVLTLKTIISGELSILFVSHDDDDHGWQFLSGDSATTEDAAVVALKEIVELDPTTLPLGDLPPGWIATRRSANAAWEKKKR